ncbi:hypothetical protein G9P44_002336 [Scheffersomyces stipitis]|nr:hypothetical protein G9P44_002336 [Scheffersomyces stipitis]
MSSDDNGFDSKNWVWIPDTDDLFTKGYITDYNKDGTCQVTVVGGNGNGTQRVVPQDQLENCNPAKFNKCNDMAELTHLNEPSVVYNLYLRYNDDLIYTYSGLFLVAINPYKSLPIYDTRTLERYHSHVFERPPPHIFATAEGTYRNLLSNKKNQSILVTGESGAGKTENTKKIIQYLSSITHPVGGSTPSSPEKIRDISTHSRTIDTRILQANPILESFGNAKTIKNNNSSRFGKFIQIYFSSRGEISRANIDYYLLEKSRVVYQASQERNYHVFYQFLKGYDQLSNFGLNKDITTYKYLNNPKITIPNVDDFKEFNILSEAFKIMGFEVSEINHIFQILAVVLHLGNLEFTSWKSEQASFTQESPVQIITELLGIDQSDFTNNILRPKVKAGREFVQKSKKASEAKYAIDAFAKHLYEKLFQLIIARINVNLENDSDQANEDLNFIGVLDIAGFEIFEMNSFEQLCINYTNEKLQQFFNHHSFILEQSEYLKEAIQWEFIDFGLDLQPTIDLIETKNPMGVFKLLDEECVIPNSSDKSFMEKLADHWASGQSKKFQQNKFKSGFIIHHYAGLVEYNVDGWLQKNTDPVSENLLSLLPYSSNNFIRDMFENDDHLVVDPKRGAKLQTASSKHKDQLKDLMDQLECTEPHFVRCILPNLNKKANKFDKNLVLSQLRCNGVLEGIRITRAGYPNRMTFDEFYQRYAIINVKEIYTKDLKTNSERILRFAELDPDTFKVGVTKIFFKNGILGKLEEMRDVSLKRLFTDVQSVIRGTSIRSNLQKKIREVQSAQIIARTMKQLDESRSSSLWMDLFINIKPLLEESVKVLEDAEMSEKVKDISSKLEEAEKSKSNLEDENSKLKEQVNKLEEVETSKNNLENDNTKLKEQINKLEDEIITTTNLVKDKDLKLEKAKSEEAKISSRIREFESKINQMKQENNKLSEEKKLLDSKLKESSENSNRNIADLSSLTKERDDFKSKLADLELVVKKHKLEKVEREKHIEDLKKEHASLKSSSESKVEDMKQLSRKLEEEISKNSLILPKHESLLDEVKKLKDLLSKSESDLESKDREIQETMSKQKLFEEENIKVLEGTNKALKKEVESHKDEIAQKNAQVEKLQIQVAKLSSLEKETEQLNTLVTNQSLEIQNLQEQLSDSVRENKSLSVVVEKLKVDYDAARIAKEEYSDKIFILSKKLSELEEEAREKEIEKENQPPDPAFVEEFAHIKLKLNENTAALRKEKFENKKLVEELSMLRDRFHNESQQDRSPIKQNELRSRTETLDSLHEEINSLKLQLQQEMSNSQRAENYAIDIQKKLNRLSATRGINSWTDYEKKFRESQRRVSELEGKFEEFISADESFSEASRSISKSDSFGRISFSMTSNSDFAQIYQDITKTLRTTREELTTSKSEILRLKSLLRESEDELYSAKTANFKTSISDYEDKLAQLTVRHDTLRTKNSDLASNLELYKRRSEEYYDKLELAEAAVQISKRHEESALNDLNETKNQLKLAKEEARTSQIMIKEIRTNNSKLEETIQDKNFAMKQQEAKIKELKEKIYYHKKNYENKEKTDKYREEIITLNKELAFKTDTENSLIKDSKKLQLDLEDLTKEKKTLEEDYALKIEHVNVLETRVDLLSNKSRQLENAQEINDRKIGNLNKQVSSLRELVESVTNQRDELLETKAKLEDQLSELTHKLDLSEAELAQTNKDMNILRTHLENQRQESSEIKSELSQSRSSISSEMQDYQKLRKEHLVSSEENITLKKINKELSSKVHELEEKLYGNEQLRFWEDKVRDLMKELDNSQSENHEASRTIKNLEKDVKQLEIKIANEAQLRKKYNDENFDYQNKVSHYKSSLDILQNEQSEKDLQIRTAERENINLKESKLSLEKEVLELRQRLGINA